uniref:Uncharacterized protein n=1 Tax=Anopheles culicifacies TaxID=139723 RepID=A0A182MBL1_9DIPT
MAERMAKDINLLVLDGVLILGLLSAERGRCALGRFVGSLKISPPERVVEISTPNFKRSSLAINLKALQIISSSRFETAKELGKHSPVPSPGAAVENGSQGQFNRDDVKMFPMCARSKTEPCQTVYGCPGELEAEMEQIFHPPEL